MRLLHTSDWHLGRRLHGADLLADQALFLEWLLEVAQSEQRRRRAGQRRRLRPCPAGRRCHRAHGPHGRGVRPGPDPPDHLQRQPRQRRAPAVRRRGPGRRGDPPAYITRAGRGPDRAVRATGGRVGVYGIPYLLPDAVGGELDVDRLARCCARALVERIRCRRRGAGLERVVVMAHAFVTGGSACESEREIRVGGVGDTPAEVFDGVSYVALGHLHGPQEVRLAGSSTVVEYCGSPLAFSFSERDHTKSVTVVDIDAAGTVVTRRIPTPVPRPLVQVRGRLEDLLERADGDLAGLADAWVKVVLTDPGSAGQPDGAAARRAGRTPWSWSSRPSARTPQLGLHPHVRGQRPRRDLRGVRRLPCPGRRRAAASAMSWPTSCWLHSESRCGLMRLHTLQMNAVGPFADEQIIDFDRLGSRWPVPVRGSHGGRQVDDPRRVDLRALRRPGQRVRGPGADALGLR